ncbi:MAG: hypothetical protein ACR2GU_10780 [Rubrobacteraceae bacterium]
MSDDIDPRKTDPRTGQDRQGPGERLKNETGAMLLGGRISATLGLLLAIGGVIGAFLGIGAGVSAGAIGIVLGLIGYFLGARKFGLAVVIISTGALFFGLAASQGLIPGINQYDRTLPPNAPGAGGNG